MAILTTASAEIPYRRIRPVLGVVLCAAGGLAAAFAAMEDLTLECRADFVLDVHVIMAAAFDPRDSARFLVCVTGTAVKLDRIRCRRYDRSVSAKPSALS